MEKGFNVQRIIERQAELINFPAPVISTCSFGPLMVCRINPGNNAQGCLLGPVFFFARYLAPEMAKNLHL